MKYLRKGVNSFEPYDLDVAQRVNDYGRNSHITNFAAQGVRNQERRTHGPNTASHRDTVPSDFTQLLL
jgi:hypothetical protein